MAFKNYAFHATGKHLLDGNWSSNSACVQLLGNGYTFNATHTTRADISAHVVGSPINVTGKASTYTSFVTNLDCDDITVTGSPAARWAAFLFWNGTTADNADKLISVIDLNTVDQVDVSITEDLQMSTSGLLQLNFSNA